MTAIGFSVLFVVIMAMLLERSMFKGNTPEWFKIIFGISAMIGATLIAAGTVIFLWRMLP